MAVERLPSMDELLGRHVDLGSVRKIGEGTFGEAFAGGAPHSPPVLAERPNIRQAAPRAIRQWTSNYDASAAILYMSRCKGMTSQQGWQLSCCPWAGLWQCGCCDL